MSEMNEIKSCIGPSKRYNYRKHRDKNITTGNTGTRTTTGDTVPIVQLPKTFVFFFIIIFLEKLLNRGMAKNFSPNHKTS